MRKTPASLRSDSPGRFAPESPAGFLRNRWPTSAEYALGHWYFRHGTRIEELEFLDLNYNGKVQERLLNLFAAYLLMPSWAVKQAFLQRGYEPANCSALQAYIVSGQLGVGYSTLIKHLRSSLGVISPEHASRLLKITPKHIREAILGGDRTRHLVVVDRAWSKVPIDLQVGEMAIVPPKVKLEGKSVGKVGIHELGSIVEGGVPGIARVESNDGSWATFIRVS